MKLYFLLSCQALSLLRVIVKVSRIPFHLCTPGLLPFCPAFRIAGTQHIPWSPQGLPYSGPSRALCKQKKGACLWGGSILLRRDSGWYTRCSLHGCDPYMEIGASRGPNVLGPDISPTLSWKPIGKVLAKEVLAPCFAG